MTRSVRITKARDWHDQECGCNDMQGCDTRSARMWQGSLGDASAFGGRS